MHADNWPITKKLTLRFLLIPLVALLCSCAATTVKRTWKSPNSQLPVGKMAVLAVAEQSSLLREGFENRLVREVKLAGGDAVVTYDKLSLTEIKQDRHAAEARFQAEKTGTLLLMRLVSAEEAIPSMTTGAAQAYSDSGGTFVLYDPMGWYDFYTSIADSFSPIYGEVKANLFIETSLFDLKTEKRLWKCVTRTVVKEDGDRVALMEPLARTVVKAMRKDGVIR
jgi:hypothetical protein